jgi:hypothetical protein
MHTRLARTTLSLSLIGAALLASPALADWTWGSDCGELKDRKNTGDITEYCGFVEHWDEEPVTHCTAGCGNSGHSFGPGSPDTWTSNVSGNLVAAR